MIYSQVETIVELTKEQDKRLKDLVKQARKKGCKWNEKETLEFLTMIRNPQFWDIQLNMYDDMVQKL